MSRLIYSILFLICLAPIQFGCGEEAPMTPDTDADPAEEIDPASEGEAMKDLGKNEN